MMERSPMPARSYAFVVLALACSLVAACGGGSGTNGDGGNGCDSYRRFPCSTSPTGLCDVNGNPASPLTDQDLAYVASHCQGHE